MTAVFSFMGPPRREGRWHGGALEYVFSHAALGLVSELHPVNARWALPPFTRAVLDEAFTGRAARDLLIRFSDRFFCVGSEIILQTDVRRAELHYDLNDGTWRLIRAECWRPMAPPMAVGCGVTSALITLTRKSEKQIVAAICASFTVSFCRQLIAAREAAPQAGATVRGPSPK